MMMIIIIIIIIIIIMIKNLTVFTISVDDAHIIETRLELHPLLSTLTLRKRFCCNH